jgi:copper chaperone CopZ
LKTALVFILMLSTLCIAAEEKILVKVDGMTCSGCVNSVTAALQKVEGVKSADVQLKPGSATVIFDNDKANLDKLITSITAIGYKASIDSKAVTVADKAVTSADTKVKTAEVKLAQTKTGCPMASKCKDVGTKAKCAPDAQASSKAAIDPAALRASESKEVDHACITITQCKELNEFHEAMHPLHMALGSEQYDVVRAGYLDLAAKAEAVKMMKCDKSCVKDVDAFEQYRQDLLVSVARLGEACQNGDDNKVAEAFDRMHEAYNRTSELAK